MNIWDRLQALWDDNPTVQRPEFEILCEAAERGQMLERLVKAHEDMGNPNTQERIAALEARIEYLCRDQENYEPILVRRIAALEALLREAPVPYSYDEQGMWDQHPAYIHWFYRVQEALQDAQ